MARPFRCLLAGVTLMLIAGTAFSDELDDISNFRAYSDHFASSGQPTEAQLEKIAAAGFERIVYIAWSDHEKSLPNEDRLVKSLGMQYLHIPVDWNSPSKEDFYLFAGAMQKAPARKTLLHCQVNFRASAFSLLYRVLYEDVDLAEAKRDMNSVWQPDSAWRDLILEILAENGIDSNCKDCDWSVPPATD